MGQGVYTSISMILAEELDANWDKVKVEAAPPNDALYGNPTFKEQMTGNSNSIRAFWMPLRKAAAGTRATLIEAAAKRWNADPQRLPRRERRSRSIRTAGSGSATAISSMPPRRSRRRPIRR